MRRKRSTMRKERIIMLASSVFVLTALTMTGFYVKEKNEAEKDGYVVDMSALEKKTGEKTKEIADAVKAENAVENTAQGNDLDYDPNFQEASSAGVTNAWDKTQASARAEENEEAAASKAGMNTEAAEVAASADETGAAQAKADEAGPDQPAEEAASAEAGDAANASVSEAEIQETGSMDAAKALSFQERENLGWPVAGNVLINYSMDKTVYFPTLQQYRYSPAIVISASEGENITASADGKVLSVFEDVRLGKGITMDIGNGYELTYGQLQDIMVLQGDVVSAGDVLGKVAAPTKYYSEEGPNVYFKLTKDGAPVNPLSCLE